MALHHFEKILADPQLGFKWGKTWGKRAKSMGNAIENMGNHWGKPWEIDGENTIKKTQGIEMFESKIEFYS